MKFIKKIDISKNYIYILFILSLVIASILLITTCYYSTDQRDYIYSPKVIKPIIIDRVLLKASDGSAETVDLPVKKEATNSYSYNFIIKKDKNKMKQYVNVNVHSTSFVLRHNNAIIYEKKREAGSIIRSMGESFNLIDIPTKYLGEILTIEFTSNIPNKKAIIIPKIVIGTKNGLRKYHFYNELFSLFSSSALFINAIFISIVGLFFLTIGQKTRNLFISVLFSVMMSFYILFNTWMGIFYLDNYLLSYIIKYTCLLLLPVPIFLLFLNSLYESEYTDYKMRRLEIFILIVFMNFIIQSMLTALGISEFLFMDTITIGLLILASIYITYFIYQIDKRVLKIKKNLLFATIPLNGLIIAIIIKYYKLNLLSTMPLMIFSIIAFLLSFLTIDLKKYMQEYNLAIEDDFYNELAYHDILTGLSNRHAFDQQIKNIISEDLLFDTLHLFILDINNFKTVNDNYSHKLGDEYLKFAGTHLLHIEHKYKDIQSYRYGGDEFILLAFNKEENEIQKIIHDINSLSNTTIIADCSIPLEFAIGYAVCNNKDSLDISILKEDADKKMYKDKMEKKHLTI